MVRVERRVEEVIRAVAELGYSCSLSELRRYMKETYKMGSARLYELLKTAIKDGLLKRTIIDTARGPRVIISIPGEENIAYITVWAEMSKEIEESIKKTGFINDEIKTDYENLLKAEIFSLLDRICVELFWAIDYGKDKGGEDLRARKSEALKAIKARLDAVISPILDLIVSHGVLEPFIAREAIFYFRDGLFDFAKRE
jgi:DNA-binding PadR family transcriptional regulator